MLSAFAQPILCCCRWVDVSQLKQGLQWATKTNTLLLRLDEMGNYRKLRSQCTWSNLFLWAIRMNNCFRGETTREWGQDQDDASLLNSNPKQHRLRFLVAARPSAVEASHHKKVWPHASSFRVASTRTYVERLWCIVRMDHDISAPGSPRSATIPDWLWWWWCVFWCTAHTSRTRSIRWKLMKNLKMPAN